MSQIKWLLTQYLKRSELKQKSSGFTLIELLVGMLLAFLVITPLLGFMVNVMDNDRKEQAKVTSEQELKAALDFISRDLEQAVYIYDADGIAAIRSQLPKSDQQTNYFPVLVFWKRRHIVGGLPVGTGSTAGFDDTFVYSLVAYYFIKGDNANNTWSKAARIGRFEISDGYGKTNTEIESTKDAGFQIFDPNGTYTTLKDKMNNWTKSTDAYTQDILPLVDYIDQTTISESTEFTRPNCPLIPGTQQLQQVPNYAAGATGAAVADANLKTGSFYVCVKSSPTSTATESAITVAQVHLRGNAFARIENDDNRIKYSGDKKVYFPEVSARVKGRGFLFTK